MQYIIDISTLKKRSYINSDVNDETLIVTLQRVQDRYLEPVLGSLLYKRLLQGVEDDDLNTAENKLIDDYIVKFVYVGCELKTSVHGNWKIRNKSVGTATDEHVNANGINEENNLNDELGKDLSFYRNRLIGFLKDNKDDYPQYKCSDKKEDLNPGEKGTNYTDIISFV
jgi:hypothetical protein